MNALARFIGAGAETALIELTARFPSVGLRACDLAASARRVAGFACTQEAVNAFFPGAGSRTWKEVVRQRFRSRITRGVSLRKAVAPYRAWPSPDLASLRGPAVLATFHVGAMEMLGVTLDQLQTPVRVLMSGLPLSRASAVTVGRVPKNDPVGRAAPVHDAVYALRRQQLVLVAVDGGEEGTFALECLGHTIRLGRGAFALARITGAPLIPLVARWRGTSIEPVIGEPIRPGGASTDIERDLATAAVRWLERYLLESPGEIGPAMERFIPASNSLSAS